MKYIKYILLIVLCFAASKVITADTTSNIPAEENIKVPEISPFETFLKNSEPKDITSFSITFVIERDKKNYNEEAWTKICKILRDTLTKYPDLDQAKMQDMLNSTIEIVRETAKIANEDETSHGFINILLNPDESDDEVTTEKNPEETVNNSTLPEDWDIN